MIDSDLQRRKKPRARLLQRVSSASVLLLAAMLASGCSLHFRVWTGYETKVLSRRRAVERLPNSKHSFKLVFEKGRYYLAFRETRLCRKVSIEKVQETAKVRVRAPLAPYYMAIGAVVAACSVPFFYMAATSTGDRKRNNALVGSFAFLAPGAGLLGFGLYQHFAQGTRTTDLGTSERRREGQAQPCGSGPAAGRTVKVGTQVGLVVLGKTDARGRILLPHQMIQPLIRRELGKIVKVYIEVYLDGDLLGTANVPWPLSRLHRLD